MHVNIKHGKANIKHFLAGKTSPPPNPPCCVPPASAVRISATCGRRAVTRYDLPVGRHSTNGTKRQTSASGSAALASVQDRLRRGFIQLKLCAHFLQAGGKGFDLLLLPFDIRLLFLVLTCSLRNSFSNIAFTAS